MVAGMTSPASSSTVSRRARSWTYGKATPCLINSALIAFSAACWASKHRSSKYASGGRVFASARLLRARFNHSRGSSGGKRSGDIDDFPFPQRWRNHQRMAIAIAVNVLRGDNDDVHRLSHPVHVLINLPCQLESMPTGIDHQQIDITVRSHLSPGGRAKEDNLLRLRYFDDASDDLVQRLLSDGLFLLHRRYTPCEWAQRDLRCSTRYSKKSH